LSLVLAAATLCVSLTVHDGDTIRCGDERIRIENIDAPELPGSSRCSSQSRQRLAGSKNPPWCDYALAYKSRDALAALLRGRVMIERTGVDQYGRTIARVSANGRDAGSYLVSQRLARWWR
jgi:micrococcal nuclease